MSSEWFWHLVLNFGEMRALLLRRFLPVLFTFSLTCYTVCLSLVRASIFIPFFRCRQFSFFQRSLVLF